MNKTFVFALLFLVAGPLFAAPQPVLEPEEAEKLRALPFSVSRGNSLIVRSRQVAKVTASGAGQGSKHGFSQEGGLIKEVLWLRFHNAGRESWAGCSVNFAPNFNVARYNSLVIWVRALESGQRFMVTLQDKNWKDRMNPQASSEYFPLWGLDKNKIYQVVIPFKALSNSASVDFAHLSRMGFQFGRRTAGNKDGNIIEVLGIAFVEQNVKLSQIYFVDIDGNVDKHPHEKMRAIAPRPTPIPKPSFAPKPVAKKPPLPKSKDEDIKFATDPTYFKAVSHGVTIYREPSSDSQPVGVLEEKKPYIGLRSQKMDRETWFLLYVDSHTHGWVPGSEVEFAEAPDESK